MQHPLSIATDNNKPVPAGWYTVCAADALKPGTLLAFELARLKLLAWRSESGTVSVADRRCPHMGGDLGRGQVSGETLRCPIHHFAFDAHGQCQSTGFADVSSKACLKPWPLMEINGLVLVFYHPQAAAPQWQPEAFDWQGWSQQRVHSTVLNADVQLITEGIADKGHLNTVHGYSDVSLDQPFETDGAKLTTAYSFTNSGSLPGSGKLSQWLSRLLPLQMQVAFDYQAWGLGYSFTEVHIPKLGVRMRHFVNPTPVNNNEVKLFYSIALGPVNPADLHPLLKAVPASWVRALLFRALHKGFLHDINDDIAMWSSMQPLEKPQLCKADGPVNKFRQWAQQFYSQ